MNKIKFQNGVLVEISSVLVDDELMRNHIRSVATISTVGIDYAQATRLFVDSANWSIVETTEQGEQEYDWSNYGVAGSITDNRDGTLIIKMGKNNTVEQDLQDNVNTARQETAQAQAVTKALAGQGVETVEAAQVMRVTIENAAALLPDSEAAAVPSLSKPWTVGETVQPGDRRYYPLTGLLYKVQEGQGHTTQADWTPDKTPAMWVVVDVEHAGTQDDPIPAAKGMEYEYGKYYSDPDDGKIYLCKRIGEAEGGKIVLQYLPHDMIGQYFEEA